MPPDATSTKVGCAPLSGVQRVLVVGSGKGGVGKSTVAWALALALKTYGLRVGLLDADVHGPSLSRLLGLHTQPDLQTENDRLLPVMCSGLACMSMGFLMPQDEAVVWRGPMLIKALDQMLYRVMWSCHGALDCLIVDLPPGTGDIVLNVMQRVAIDGVLLVTTPHPLALDDVARAKAMCRRLGAPYLGIVENMAFATCQACAHRHKVFESDGQHALQTDVLVRLPFLWPSEHSHMAEWASELTVHIMSALWGKHHKASHA